MKNFIIEDTEENLEALKSCFFELYRNIYGKAGEDEVLIASVENNVLIELEYWVLNGEDFPYIKDAKPATLKELLEATNALN